MAAASVFQHGVGGTTGHALVTERPYWALAGAVSGCIWYVGPGGDDAAIGSGGLRERPLATIAQALTNASAGDTIVLLSGYTASLSSAVTFNKADITLVSEGTGSSRARITCTGTVAMFDVTAVGVCFLNIYFPASTAVAVARIRSAASGTLIEDCYFECGASDTNWAVKFINGANYARITGATFTAVAAGSIGAFNVDVGATMSGLTVEDVTVDGGSFGWGSASPSVQCIGTLTGLKVLRINLLNNSDMWIGASVTGHVVPGESSGAAYIFQG